MVKHAVSLPFALLVLAGSMMFLATTIVLDSGREQPPVFYDDTPAMVIDKRGTRLVKTKLRPGEPIRYWLKADKRADCHPPHGWSKIDYFVYFSERRYVELNTKRNSRLKPGRKTKLKRPTEIQLPDLKPGKYGFQWIGHYTCARSRFVQHIPGPRMAFEVIAAE